MTSTTETRRPFRSCLRFAIPAVVLGAVFIWVWVAFETRHERYFLSTFERSVSACRSERSMARAIDAVDAADLCETMEAKRIMEERCVEAFRNRDRYAQLVAGHVIDSRNSLSVETLQELSELYSAFPEGSVQRDDLKYIIRQFDDTGVHIGRR